MDRGHLGEFCIGSLERGNVAAVVLATARHVAMRLASLQRRLDVTHSATATLTPIWTGWACLVKHAAALLADKQIVSFGHYRLPHCSAIASAMP